MFWYIYSKCQFLLDERLLHVTSAVLVSWNVILESFYWLFYWMPSTCAHAKVECFKCSTILQPNEAIGNTLLSKKALCYRYRSRQGRLGIPASFIPFFMFLASQSTVDQTFRNASDVNHFFKYNFKKCFASSKIRWGENSTSIHCSGKLMT